jgi:hypothetical protein
MTFQRLWTWLWTSVEPDDEIEGLDSSQHGESGYNLRHDRLQVGDCIELVIGNRLTV